MIKPNLISSIISGDDSNPKVRIAKAAISEFAMRSLDGARTREIAKKSGTNLAAISYHFGGKEGLYKTVINEMSSYFDAIVAPYYLEGKKISDQNDSASAKKIAQSFILDCIKKFSELKIISSLCLIMVREEASPSDAFTPVFDSIYDKPTKFIAEMLVIASKKKIAKDMSLVFAQALWSNVRAYSARNCAVLKLHGWTEFSENEFEVVKSALNKVVEKTLK